MRKRTNQPVTLNDVAADAGVSPSTVSLYIRKLEKVSLKIGKKIQNSIDTKGYVHNKIASQFTGSQSSTIALIVPSISNAVISDILQEIDEQVSKSGLQLKIASHDHNLQKEEEQLRSMLEWSPAVVIIAGCDHTSKTMAMLENTSVPVIQMLELGGDRKTQVGFDHHKAGYEVARYLHDSGCKKIAFFTTRLEDDLRAKKRCDSYALALQELGLNHQPIIIDIPYSRNIYDDAKKYLSMVLANEKGIDGIIATSDAIGIGLLMEANRQGIAIPERLSIIGFGDFPISASLGPVSLSSVNLNNEHLAKELAKAALSYCLDSDFEGGVVDTKYSIVPRQSTKLVF